MAIGNGSQPAGSAGAEALPYASTIAFLVSQVGACSAQRFEEALSKINLLPREFAVLAIIDGSHSPMNQQAVAEALDIHRNGVVTLVDALEERGWVRRQRAPSLFPSGADFHRSPYSVARNAQGRSARE